MDIANGSNIYQVGKAVAEADGYHLYLCVQEETGRQCLLQIAAETANNGDLDRAAYILRELKKSAQEVEDEYAKIKKDPKILLNYKLSFPRLVDSFSCQEQGGRRINILHFRKIKEVGDVVPLSNITLKDQLRVDLRTSVWILGKLLKLFVFTQSEFFSVGLVNGNNILIAHKANQRYVLIFDWSKGQMHPGGVPMETRRQEISQAAQAVIAVLGGDFQTGYIPDDGEPAFQQYADHLFRLARGSESDATRAHAKFYELVDMFWKREFYPFTTLPLDR